MSTDTESAHEFSLNHRNQLENDKICGCFYCIAIFNPKEIQSWIKDRNGDTAICPYCDIDSIIGESSGFPINKEFLQEMNNRWFE